MSNLETLIELSGRIGQNLNLVQAGGGNTSWKDGEYLWIKASGKWLIHSVDEDIFLPVPMADIMAKLRANEERFNDYPTRSGLFLRPSVETTMHAVLPQRVVIHVHSVQTIAWACRTDGEAELANRLDGLLWKWIPYIHPGVPLALRIEEDLRAEPNVLILANHGLVVAADDCDAAEALLYEVERRLAVDVPPAPEFDEAGLEVLVAGSGWQLAPDIEMHALATKRKSSEIASGGTLFPDQCVYVGPSAAILQPGESIADALDRHEAATAYRAKFLLVPGKGVITDSAMDRAAHELLVCLTRAVARIPEGVGVTYLEESQVARLMNWDAEKYRLAMALAQR